MRFWQDLNKIEGVSDEDKLLFGKNSNGATYYITVLQFLQKVYEYISIYLFGNAGRMLRMYNISYNQIKFVGVSDSANSTNLNDVYYPLQAGTYSNFAVTIPADYYNYIIRKDSTVFVAEKLEDFAKRKELGLISSNKVVNEAFKEFYIEWSGYDGSAGVRNTTSTIILHGWGITSNLQIQIASYFVVNNVQALVYNTFLFSKLANGLYYSTTKGIKIYISDRDISYVPIGMQYNQGVTLQNNVVEKIGANVGIQAILRADNLNANVNNSITTINGSITTINTNIANINNALGVTPDRNEVGLISNLQSVNRAFSALYLDYTKYNGAYGNRDTNNSSIVLYGWGIDGGIKLQLKSYFNFVQVTHTYLFVQVGAGIYRAENNGIVIFLAVRNISLVPTRMTYNFGCNLLNTVVENIAANAAILGYINANAVNDSLTVVAKGQYTSNRAIEKYFDELYLVKGTSWDDSAMFQLTFLIYNGNYNIKVALYDPANQNANTAILQYYKPEKPSGLVDLTTTNPAIFANSKILLNNIDAFAVDNNRAVNLTFTAKAFDINNNASIKGTISSSGINISELLFSDSGVFNKAISNFYIDKANYDGSQGEFDEAVPLTLTGWGLSYRLGVEIRTKNTAGALIYFFTYLYLDPTIPNLYFREIQGIKIYAVVNNPDLIPSEMTYEQTIGLNKNLVYSLTSNPYTYLNSFKFSKLNFENLKEATKLRLSDKYLSNPNNGLLGSNLNLLTNCDYDTVQTSGNRYVWLSDLIDDSCISETGVINNTALLAKITNFFNSNFDLTKNIRYTLRLLSCWNASASGTANAVLVDNPATADGKSWVWMPANMYTYLRTKTNALITTINQNVYPTTQNVVITDFRSTEVLTIYEAILSNIQTYFNTTVAAPSLVSSTNYNLTTIKRGDFFIHIQFRGLSEWGEGKLNVYSDYPNSTPLIAITELFKKYFYDKIILAPSFGSRDENCPEQLRDYQLYLLKTTYGGLTKNSQNLYFGTKEFGIFVDHLNNEDTTKDYTGTNDENLLEIAKKKYKKAPCTGENGNISDVGSSVGFAKYVSMFRFSNMIAWGIESMWSVAGIEYFRGMMNYLGYRLAIVYNNLNIVDTTLSGSIAMQNIGLAPCYDDFWEIQVLTRDKTTGLLAQRFVLTENIKEVSSFLTVNIGSVDEENLKIINITRTLSNTNVNVFLTIVDKLHINENMRLANKNRSLEGEYCIRSNAYEIVYELNMGINHPNNLGVRYLYEEFELKPAKKNNATFAGWYLESNFQTEVKAISINYLLPVTLYAKFVSNSSIL